MGKSRRATSAATAPTVRPFPPLEAGDHLEQATFHERYKATPSELRAELIGGIVIVPSALSPGHGEYHALVMGWLTQYWIATSGAQARDHATTILSRTSEPQPDGVLIIDPAYGGQTGFSEDGCATGPPGPCGSCFHAEQRGAHGPISCAPVETEARPMQPPRSTLPGITMSRTLHVRAARVRESHPARV
jgi:hypothetical protein